MPGIGRQYESSSRLHQPRLTRGADEDLDGGRVVAEGTAAELKQRVRGASLDDVFLTLTRHDDKETGHV